MLGAGETDANGTKRDGLSGLLRRIGIGAHLHAGDLLTPAHELDEVLVGAALLRALVVLDETLNNLRRRGGNFAGEDETGGAVDGEEVAFFPLFLADGEGALVVVDVQGSGATDADLTHLAGNKSSVGGNTTASGEDTFGCDHATEIFRRRFDANEEDFFALFVSFDGALSVEVDLAGRGTRTCGEALGDLLGGLNRLGVEDRSEDLLELLGRNAGDRGLPVDELLFDHFASDTNSGDAGALTVASLEHEHLLFLDSELEVLHVLEVRFEDLADALELFERLRLLLSELSNGVRSADTGDNIFALGVHEELTVEDLLASGGVTGESHTGTRLRTGITEDHGLNVYGGAPGSRDAVFATVNDRAVIHPGTEDGAHGTLELVPRVGGEVEAGALFHHCLHAGDELLVVVGGELAVIGVGVVETLLLEVVDDGFKRIDIFTSGGLDTHDHVAIHLNEAAVAIPSESWVLGRGLEGLDGIVVEAEVEDRVHHARHRVAGTGANGDEEREAFGVTKLGAHALFHLLDARLNLALELDGILAAVVVEVCADLGGDGEASRNGKANAAHLSEIRALASEEVLHRGVAVSFAIAPRVNVFLGFGLLCGGFLFSGGLAGLRGGLFDRFFDGLFGCGFCCHKGSVVKGNRTRPRGT